MDSSSSDGVLIAAALEGDEQAFALLVARYQAALHKAAKSRLGRPELAEEAVQETFLCAHRWLATYDSQYSFRTWLWTILLNQCSRKAKSESRHAGSAAVGWAVPNTADFSNHEPSRSQPQPLDALLSNEVSEQVHELLAKLPDVQADALRLRFFGGLTFPEIAAAMEISEPGAKHRVKSGLLKLAEWLGARQAVGVVEEGQKS